MSRPVSSARRPGSVVAPAGRRPHMRDVERLRRARDLLAVRGFDTRDTALASLANNHNGATRPAVVFCHNGEPRLVVRRETLAASCPATSPAMPCARLTRAVPGGAS